jgi:hypothetical protein
VGKVVVFLDGAAQLAHRFAQMPRGQLRKVIFEKFAGECGGGERERE